MIKGILYWGSIAVAITIALAIFLLFAAQRAMIYPSYVMDSRNTVDKPSKHNFHKWEELWLKSSDGLKLHAYWIPYHDQNNKDMQWEVPTILCLHANAGNMGHRLPLMKYLTSHAPSNVMMLSYRGYGLSEGSPSEEGIMKDSQAALDWIIRRNRKKAPSKFSNKDIILYGQSIGGAVAIDLASRNVGKIKAFIVENTFLSLTKLVPRILPLAGLGPILARFALLDSWNSEERLKLMMENDYSTLPKMLFLSGGSDELVPPDHMKSLHEIVKKSAFEEKKYKMHIYPEGDHNSTYASKEYFYHIRQFIIHL